MHFSNRQLQETEVNAGDTAWVLVSTALVLFMTVPGLSLFYVGMVRQKNVLTTIMQIFSITCLITVLWMMVGYSLAFAPAHATGEGYPVYGDASRFWLEGLGQMTFHSLASTIPEAAFCVYQLTFAIITPALITGSFADRMRYLPMLLFITLWHVLVYCPIAHSSWHPDGFLYKAGVLDFAGGNVVHISSGVAGLVSCVVLGHRKGLGVARFEAHNILLTAVGASMLWVGWFGFNGGSALKANHIAAFAILQTQIAASVAGFSWMLTEWCIRKRPSLLGMVSGAVAGLVAITPGAGFVTPTGAFFIGLIAGPVCYGGVQLKHQLGYDDALDAFGVHAVGGVCGGILVGFFATEQTGIDVNGILYSHSPTEGWHQLGLQLYGIVVCAAWSAVVSYLLLQLLDWTVGLRVTEKEEDDGLDVSLHGETIILKGEHFERRIPTPTLGEAHSPGDQDHSNGNGGGGNGSGVDTADRYSAHQHSHSGAAQSDVGTSMELYEQAMSRVLEPLQHSLKHRSAASAEVGADADLSTVAEVEMKECKGDDAHDHKTVTFASV